MDDRFRRSRRRVATALFLLATSAGAALAQSAPAAPRPCSRAEHRQFDFWLGDWTVVAGGQERGRNRITRLYGDCGVREEYETLDGSYAGTSVNLYDESRGVWHQTWVDDQGLLLTIEGGFRDGKMVMEGELVGADGKRSRQRITWTPHADGTLRQHWESSGDSGTSWTTVFDGTYRRRAG